MRGAAWGGGTIESCAKVYTSGGLKRAAIGMMVDRPFLWEAPFTLLALAVGEEPKPHLHLETIETGLFFGTDVKAYRHLGTPNERVDLSAPGTFNAIYPGELHRIDSRELKERHLGCFGYTVALPGAALDHAVQGGSAPARSAVHSTTTGAREHSLRWNYVYQEGEGAFLKIHAAMSAGQVLDLGAFPQRAPGSVVLSIFVGGRFSVKGPGSVLAIDGQGISFSAGDPLEIRCLDSGPEERAQVGFAVLLPVSTADSPLDSPVHAISNEVRFRVDGR